MTIEFPIKNYPPAVKRILLVHTRQEAIDEFKKLYERGYRWIVRDMDSQYLCLFSIKPKKYVKMEFWGYSNENAPGVMMCELVKNADITEINWKNRQPTELWQFIKDNEVAKHERD